MNTPDEGFAPDRIIAEHLGVHAKTLPRWDKRPELGFPKPIYLNGRKFRAWAEVRAWVSRAAIEYASKPQPTFGKDPATA
jgi:hypothetical protein